PSPAAQAPQAPAHRQHPQAAARPQQRPLVQAEPAPARAPDLRCFEDVVARARAERDRLLVFELERHVRPVRFEPGRVEIALTADAATDLPQRLGQVLGAWTGTRWMVAVTQEATAAGTLH